MKQIATLNAKGQITIPKDVRNHLGLKQGDQVSFEIKNSQIVLRLHSSERNPFEVFRGVLAGFTTECDVNGWLSDLRND